MTPARPQLLSFWMCVALVVGYWISIWVGNVTIATGAVSNGDRLFSVGYHRRRAGARRMGRGASRSRRATLFLVYPEFALNSCGVLS
jgi:hypothetical protein